MKSVPRITSTTLIVLLLPWLLGQGCPTTTESTGGGSDASDLSDLEKQAISYAAKSASCLNQGTFVVQSSTGDLVNGSSQVQPQDVSFGTCPAVTKTGSLLESQPTTLMVDFGTEPCTVLVAQDGSQSLICSGSASGTFDRQARTIGLQFNNISCGNQSLDGSADVTYSIGTNIDLTGNWGLTWITSDFTTITNGSGTCSYDTQNWITTMSTFTGTVADNLGWSFSVDMTDIKVSFSLYASFIPYSGSMTLSGSDIRTISLTFNENSPAAGEVQVSIAGVPSFTVSLADLDAALTTLEAV
ncbi:MAG: hypothetical protein ACYTBZ_05285 [Planctomycetota bacterium]